MHKKSSRRGTFREVSRALNWRSLWSAPALRRFWRGRVIKSGLILNGVISVRLKAAQGRRSQKRFASHCVRISESTFPSELRNSRPSR